LHCINCGLRIPSVAKFCPRCGSKQVLLCHSCGETVTAGDAYCLNCGVSIENGEPCTAEDSPKDKDTTVVQEQTKHVSLDDYYRQVLAKCEQLEVMPKIEQLHVLEFEKEFRMRFNNDEYRILQRCFGSFYDAIKNHATDVVDSKIQASIRSTLKLYQDRDEVDTNLLFVALFMYQKQTDRKKNTSSCLDVGLRDLYKYQNGAACAEFALSNASLSDILPVWNYFIASPQILLYIINKGFYRTREFNNKVGKAVQSLFDSSVVDVSVKSFVYYSIAKQMLGETRELEALAAQNIESSELCESLFKMVCAELEERFEESGIVLTFQVKSTSGKVVSDSFDLVAFTVDALCPHASLIRIGDGVRLLHSNSTGAAKIIEIEKPDDETHRNLNDLYKALSKERVTTQVSIILSELRKILGIGTVEAQKKEPITPNAPYSIVVKKNQQSKSEAECREVIEILKKLSAVAGPNRLSAVKDLIQFYGSSKVCAFLSDSTDLAISTFETYRDLFLDSEEEHLKLIKLIMPFYLKSKRYDTAIQYLLPLVKKTKNVVYYNQLSYLYLQVKDFSRALTYVNQVLNSSNSAQMYVFTACSYGVYACVGLQDFEKAEVYYKKFVSMSTSDERNKQLRKFVDEARFAYEGNSTAEFESLLSEELEGLDWSRFRTHISKDLYSMYLQRLLESCQYEGVRNREWSEETQKFTWIPANSEQAMEMIRNIESNASILSKTNTIRAGMLQQVTDYRLAIAKISDYCMNAYEEDASFWYGRFLLNSSRVFWCIATQKRFDSHVVCDSVVFFYGESARLISKISLDDAYQKTFEFYDALNNYFGLKLLGMKPQDFNEIKPFKQEQTLLQTAKLTFVETLSDAISTRCRETMQHMALLLMQSSGLSEFLYGIINENTKKLLLSELKEMLPVPITDIASGMDSYIEILNKNRLALSDVLIQLADIVKSHNTEQLSQLINRFNELAQSSGSCLNSHEIRVFEALQEMVENFCEAIKTNNYTLQQSLCTKITREAELQRSAIIENPTSFSYDHYINVIEEIIRAVNLFSEQIIDTNLPEISFSDDNDEDYFPVNSTISVQLCISNSEGCTPANGLRVRFDQMETEHYTMCRSIYEYDTPLDGGQKVIIPIELSLTLVGAAPDAVFDLCFLASYRTIQNKEVPEKEYKVSIHLKSDKDFIPIVNPYTRNELKPPQGNRVFYGRKKDITKICSAIENRDVSGTTVVIYGQYRSGKSSLKNYIKEQLKQNDSKIIIADMGSIDRDYSLGTILEEIAHAMFVGLEERSISTSLIEKYRDRDLSSESIDHQKTYFKRFLSVLKQTADSENVHLVLVIDEMGRLFAGNIDTYSFTEYWKSVMSEATFDAILVGHDVLTKILSENPNAFGSTIPHQLNYLSMEDAISLIQEPIYSEEWHPGRYKDDAVQYILHLTAGNTYFIQMICDAAVNYMNVYHYNRLNESSVRDAIVEYFSKLDLSGRSILFHPLYQSGEYGENAIRDEEAKDVLWAISVLNDPQIQSNNEKIYDLLSKSSPTEWSQQRVNMVLRSLMDRWVIEDKDGKTLDRNWIDGEEIDKDMNFFIRVRLYEYYLTDKFTMKGWSRNV